MVFISFPRQISKTTFALGFIKHGSPRHPAYLNWDNAQDRDKIKSGQLAGRQNIFVFDEIHKFAHWRGLIKGHYDKYHDVARFMVTGSARLDYFRKGGDSLFGRYFHYRLHPFSLGELNGISPKMDVRHLLKFGGFPEPLFSGSERTLKRWQKERRHKIIYEDLRDLESVREISLLDLLVDALPSRIGSPLSVKSLAEDLQVSFNAVERWI